MEKLTKISHTHSWNGTIWLVLGCFRHQSWENFVLSLIFLITIMHMSSLKLCFSFSLLGYFSKYCVFVVR